MDTTPDSTPVTGILRTTWVRDELAHVLEHAGTDEPSGTWTGLACPDHGLSVGSDVCVATLLAMSAGRAVADLIWEAPAYIADEHARAFDAAMEAFQQGRSAAAERHWQDLQAIWSHAWATNYAVLGLIQQAGITEFAEVKPQRWVVASFEHHCGSHGVQLPHVHNVVVTALTSGSSSEENVRADSAGGSYG